MKNSLKIVFFLLIIQNCFSQNEGTDFFNGNWSQVLAKAKKEKKPIYIDFYAEWCGPCKIMDKQFFPDQAVGELLNNNFVAYHIDAEKGEGIELAKKYEISAYPTSVFISYEGIAFHRMVGFPGILKGIEEIKKAEKIFYTTASKGIEELDAEFQKGERSFDFINSYFKRKTATGGNLNDVKDIYLESLSESERLNPKILKLLLNSPILINSKLYDFISKQIEINALKLPIETQNALNLGIEMASTNALLSNNYNLIKDVNKANIKLNDFLILYLKQKNISEVEIQRMNDDVEDGNLKRTLNFFEKTNRYQSLDSLIKLKENELKKQKSNLKSKDDAYLSEFLSNSKTMQEDLKKSDYFKNLENQQKLFYTRKMSDQYLMFAQHYLKLKNEKNSISKAINYLNVAIDLNENDIKLRALSEAYLLQGNKKKAMIAINRAIELNPESLDLQLFQLKIEE